MPRRCVLVSPTLADKSASSPESVHALLELRDRARSLLTPRQGEILNYLLRDRAQFEIARLLRVTVRTVEREVVAIKKALVQAQSEMETERVQGVLREGVTVQTGRRTASWRADRTALGLGVGSTWSVHKIQEE